MRMRDPAGANAELGQRSLGRSSAAPWPGPSGQPANCTTEPGSLLTTSLGGWPGSKSSASLGRKLRLRLAELNEYLSPGPRFRQMHTHLPGEKPWFSLTGCKGPGRCSRMSPPLLHKLRLPEASVLLSTKWNHRFSSHRAITVK